MGNICRAFLLLLFAGHATASAIHLFNHNGRLTEASAGPPLEIARGFLRQAARSQGLDNAALAGVYLAKEYRTQHNGVTHIVYRQQFQGMDVYDAEWVVNIDRDNFMSPAEALDYGLIDEIIAPR